MKSDHKKRTYPIEMCTTHDISSAVTASGETVTLANMVMSGMSGGLVSVCGPIFGGCFCIDHDLAATALQEGGGRQLRIRRSLFVRMRFRG